MSKEEKLLLLQSILKDIRGNWANKQHERTKFALQLCHDLTEVQDIDIMIDSIKKYNYEDGRYFRCEYPYGYEDMEKLHGLEATFNDKSVEFKKMAKKILTYPDFAFKDLRSKF